jgi:FtsH-binding integral membrane protein
MQPVPSSGGSGIDTGLRGQCLFGALHSLWSNRVTHKMIRLIACGLGLAGFGVIIAEIINNAQFLGIKVKPYIVVIAFLAIFTVHELFIERIKQKYISFAGLKRKDKIVLTLYNLIYGIIGVLMFLGIPYLWWGVIKKLAMMANE